MARIPTLIEDGKDGWTEWVLPVNNKFREFCCDCNLCHDVQYKVIDGKQVAFRVRQNARATAAARRKKK